MDVDPRRRQKSEFDAFLRPISRGGGTGEHALYLASKGHEVCGIDFVPVAIERAQEKAKSRGLKAQFKVGSVLELDKLGKKFDTVIDSGLFHVFSDDDRQRYVEGLATILKPGGRLFLLCFSDKEPGTQGPRRVTKKELDDAFARGWVIETSLRSNRQ